MQNNFGNPGRWLRNWVILALGILLVTKLDLVDGIRCDNGLTLIAVVVLLSLLNTLLRPLLMLVALPLIVMTLGLFLFPAIWLINATVLYLVGNTFAMEGFRVADFWTAMKASLLISLISFFLNRIIGGPQTPASRSGAPGPGKAKSDDDVIDV